ncbi:MAG: metal-dependent transcriptional regulator [Gemmatimonadetes bacterium]|nr:metal-dependent transcriptional regulator [Gemmatimonadota bacterium]
MSRATLLLGAAVEDYLKSIYKLSLENERVTPKMVAAEQGVSLAAVSKMVKRLCEQKLVRYDRGEGIDLSPPGRKVALEIVRHHRLIEAYLCEALGYSWDEVDEEAEKLEHVISEEFEDRIDRLLGHPTHDPHGAPIPTKDGEVDHRDHPALSEFDSGRVVVQRVNDHDPAMLRYLGDCGLYPGVSVDVLGEEPFGGPIHIRVAGEEISIGKELATHVFVEVAEEGKK